MPTDVNGHYRKPQGPIKKVLEEGHGHEICLQICTDVYGPVHHTIETWIPDDKNDV